MIVSSLPSALALLEARQKEREEGEVEEEGDVGEGEAVLVRIEECFPIPPHSDVSDDCRDLALSVTALQVDGTLGRLGRRLVYLNVCSVHLPRLTQAHTHSLAHTCTHSLADSHTHALMPSLTISQLTHTHSPTCSLIHTHNTHFHTQTHTQTHGVKCVRVTVRVQSM